MKRYFAKMSGGVGSAPPRLPWSEILWSCLGVFVSLSCIYFVEPHYKDATFGLPLLFASMGASAVLVFGSPRSAYSQPRSVIGGHVLSAFAGVTAHCLLPDMPLLAVSLAATLATALMLSTCCIHPPGGATALIASLGANEFQELGYWFVLSPCLSGTVVLCTLGILINNLSPKRRYPRFWW